jgi:7-carboxy-7-deazaguanine synthase
VIEQTTPKLAEGRSVRGKISVSEIFGPTVQGEGAVIGKPTVFVRTGSCDYRCSWCDSKFAVLPEFSNTWARISPEEIFAEVKRLSPRSILVTLSGGNPALQPFSPLISLGKAEGYRFAIETQGTLARDWFADLDYLTLSPKPPSSGMKTDWEKLRSCVEASSLGAETTMKVVIFNDKDFAYAQEVAKRFPEVPMYLQVGNNAPPGPDPADENEPDMHSLLERYEWLIGKVVTDGWNDATVLPQMHVLVWGNKRGV